MFKKTKKILEAHAKATAQERYGVELNKTARREIVQKIQTGEADFVSRTSNNRTLWKVDYEDKSMNVVYDKSRHACALCCRRMLGNSRLLRFPVASRRVRPLIYPNHFKTHTDLGANYTNSIYALYAFLAGHSIGQMKWGDNGNDKDDPKQG